MVLLKQYMTGKGKGKAKVGKMGPPVDKAWLERWRMRLKIASVSFLFPFLASKIGCMLTSRACPTAPVPPSHRDAADAASKPSGLETDEAVPAASEGAVVSVQLCASLALSIVITCLSFGWLIPSYL